MENIIEASKDAYDHPIEVEDNGLGHSTEGNNNGLDIDTIPIFLTPPNIS